VLFPPRAPARPPPLLHANVWQISRPLHLSIQFDPDISTTVECTVTDALVVQRLPVPLHVSGTYHGGWTAVNHLGLGRPLKYLLRPDLFVPPYRDHSYWQGWEQR